MITNETWARGAVIREPVGSGAGYWVGAPGACYDERDRCWYLTYRIRRPRGVAPDRGGEVRIARSTDLARWEDVMSIGKDQYGSASIERSALQRGPDGGWRYYTSYVHPEDGRWCTAVLQAPAVDRLDPAKRTVLFRGPPLGLEGVKDPWILEHEGVYHLFLSVATAVPATGADSHATLDIFNTGECKSATALATSRDLEHWDWQGVVLAPPVSGWDQYCRRLNSAVLLPGGAGARRFLGFFDGSASHLENYEERCALAVSGDLREWGSRSPRGPAFTSPWATGSIRYVDAKFALGRWHLFYEFAREDGAHDLRLITCGPDELVALATGA
jgi:hypothetical protein